MYCYRRLFSHGRVDIPDENAWELNNEELVSFFIPAYNWAYNGGIKQKKVKSKEFDEFIDNLTVIGLCSVILHDHIAFNK